MFRFDCPSCRRRLEAGEEYAGKRIVCPHCGASAPVPTNADADPQGITTPAVVDAVHSLPRAPLDDDSAYDVPPSVRAHPFAWLTVGKVIGILAILILVPLAIGLLLVPAQRLPTRAAKTQSVNNLKQIGLAFHEFHDTHRHFPFNGSDIAADGVKYSAAAQPANFKSGSWAFQILPFVDQEAVFKEPAKAAGIAAYMCPARLRPLMEEPGGPWSDYFYNNYLNAPEQANRPDAPARKRTLESITDGHSNTVLVGHGSISTKQYAATANVLGSTNIFLGGTRGTMRSGDNGEIAPTGVTLRRDSAEFPDSGSWGGPFEHGGLMVMCDGTVRMFPYTTQNFSSFLTPTGNEAVVVPD